MHENIVKKNKREKSYLVKVKSMKKKNISSEKIKPKIVKPKMLRSYNSTSIKQQSAAVEKTKQDYVTKYIDNPNVKHQ